MCSEYCYNCLQTSLLTMPTIVLRFNSCSLAFVEIPVCRVDLQGTDVVERLWSKLGSWVMNKRAIRALDALRSISNIALEEKQKLGLNDAERVGYKKKGNLFPCCVLLLQSFVMMLHCVVECFRWYCELCILSK